MRMMDILPEHVREWITKMQDGGASAWTIQYGKYAILNSIFTTATEQDRVIVFHPSRGVRTPSVPSKTAADHHAGAVRLDLSGAAYGG